MDSCAQFMLKSPIITFCEEKCWPRIVQRAESKCGIETSGERYRNNALILYRYIICAVPRLQQPTTPKEALSVQSCVPCMAEPHYK